MQKKILISCLNQELLAKKHYELSLNKLVRCGLTCDLCTCKYI